MSLRFKIRQHPRMKDICIGDEVKWTRQLLYARVEEIFPAAVCVKLTVYEIKPKPRFIVKPILWRADEIENLSVCRCCGSRDNLVTTCCMGAPIRLCQLCLCDDEVPQ